MGGLSRTSSLAPWLCLGPALVIGGALLGHWLWPNTATPVWSDAAPAGSPAGPATSVAALPSFAPIVSAVKNGVVGVRTIQRAGGQAPRDDELDTAAAGQGAGIVDGSGFVIHESGLAVTNHHIVADHEQIFLEIPGSAPVPAELVGVDPVTDIAVVRFEPPAEGLTVLELGDSTRIQQGDWVVAVGNPFHYRQTVTVGVVSYVGRHIPEEGLLVSNEYLQFSASVYPGSSGGPVLDLQGHVVGVTTSTHAAGTDISFAVPTKVLKWVLERMNREGHVRRGFLGIRLEPLDRTEARTIGLRGGAVVRHVETGRPADSAGLCPGDIVVAYDGREVPDAYSLFDWITYSKPGDLAEIEVVRSGVRIAPLTARLGEVQYPPRAEREPPKPESSH